MHFDMTAYDKLGPRTRAALASATYSHSAYQILNGMRGLGSDPHDPEVDAYMAGHIRRLDQVRKMEREQARERSLANHRAAGASSVISSVPRRRAGITPAR